MSTSEQRWSGGALNAALANEHAMAPQLIVAVERLTGRNVRTFMSGTDEFGGSSVEAFVLDRESSGVGDPVAD